jgi:sugar phosphate isomerase/epimerase
VSFQYSYVTNGLTGHRLEHAVRLLADCGYGGIALTLDHVHLDPFATDIRARAARMRRLLADCGLTCVVETGGRFVLDPRRKHHPTLLSPDPALRIDFLLRSIDIASELGAPVVSIWSGARPKRLGADAAWQRLLAGCERVLKHAERRSVTIGFEPEPGMFVERLDHYEALADRLGHPPRLGLTLDLGHCVCLEPEPVAACIARGASDLVHVHVEDMRRGEHEHRMFGEGELDVTAALGSLADAGYAGQVAVELSRHAHVAHETVPRAIAYLRAHERLRVPA